MSILVKNHSGDYAERSIEEFLNALNAINLELSDESFLRELVEVLRTTLSVRPAQGRNVPDLFGLPGDESPKLARKGPRKDDQIDRIETLIESVAAGKRAFLPKEIAKLERVKPARVREWIRDGKLRSVRDPHRKAGPRFRHLILSEDYDRFKRGGH